MVAMANLNIPDRAVRQQIASAVNLMIQISRMADGTRKVSAISEITGMEQDVITMQDIFLFERTGLNREGKVVGPVPGDRRPAQVRGAADDDGHSSADRHVRARAGGCVRGAAMVFAFTFVLVLGIIVGGLLGARASAGTGRRSRASRPDRKAAPTGKLTKALLKAPERLSDVGVVRRAARTIGAGRSRRCSG